MAIRKPHLTHKREIDIDGPDGNAFCLLGIARGFGFQLGWSKAKIAMVSADMKSGDYEHLIKVFDKHFGSFVDLVRESK